MGTELQRAGASSPVARSPAVAPAPEAPARICRKPEIVAIVCGLCRSRGAAWTCETCGETLCGRCREGHA